MLKPLLWDEAYIDKQNLTNNGQQPKTLSEQDIAKFYLHAGHIFTSAPPYMVTTIVGSCVAVCLWDYSLRIGGINHYLLPYPYRNKESLLRFGESAIEILIEELLKLGCRKNRLQAKLFGGASLLGMSQENGSNIGSKNVRLAFNVLSNEGIPVVAADVEGERGRKIIFHTGDGIAWVKQL